MEGDCWVTLYEGLKTVHVLSAVLWVGGGIMVLMLASQFRAAANGPALASVGQRAGQLGKVYFMPLSVIQLLSGIWLVLEGDWGFEQFWIVAGIAGIVASSVIGAAFLGPTGEKIGDAMMAGKQMDDPEVRGLLDKVFLLNRIDIVILVLVIADMVIKPGL
jgi:uncharacterized membrane protein